VAIACGETHTLAKAKDGKLWSWGNNNYNKTGRTGNTSTIASVTQMDKYIVVGFAAGANHSMVIVDK
jgi:alpha-tubulin suppressor-like RCC1 family protein